MTTWNSAEAYERYVGRWSRLVAREFIAWVDPPERAAWLDVGCGTGALSELIAALADPAQVEGIDPSTAFIAEAEGRLSNSIFSFQVGDASKLPHTDSQFDVVASALVLTFLPDPLTGVLEMARVTKPGGSVASYVWDYNGEMQMMKCFWDVAVELQPKARRVHEGLRFQLATPEELRALFQGAGLKQIETAPLVVETPFADFDDYWEPFLGGVGPAPGYVASLADEEREELRSALKERLTSEKDGTINLTARAWAVKGTSR